MSEMYKKAALRKLRIQTSFGPLSVEQLADLKVTDLDKTAVALQKQLKDLETESFIETAKKKDASLQLAFDITLDILETKLAAEKSAADRRAKKEHNARILELIEKKKGQELEGKDIAELEAMIRD